MFKRKNLEKFIVPAVFITSLAVIFLREPSIFIHPQFWGEDGKYWYAEAYNHGVIATLFWPYAGSLQFMMRLTGSISTFLPFSFAPLFFAIVAAVIQALPAVLLATKRFSKLFGSRITSLVVAAFYLLIPNSFEVNANITNSNWHLALLAFMVIVATDKAGKWKYFDYLILVLSGLTGPFSIFLFPVAYFFWKKKKTTIAHLGLTGVCAIAQILSYLISHGGSRLTEVLGASGVRLFTIIGGRVMAPLLISMKTVGSGPINDLLLTHSYRFAVVGVFTVLLLAYFVIKGPVQLKAFILFSWATFIVALAKPQASSTLPQWQAIVQGAGNRYFFLPMISLFCGFIWLALNKNKYIKIPAIIAIIAVFLVAGIRDFSYTPEPYKDFSEVAKQYNLAPKNSEFCFAVNPSSAWITCLHKH